METQQETGPKEMGRHINVSRVTWKRPRGSQKVGETYRNRRKRAGKDTGQVDRVAGRQRRGHSVSTPLQAWVTTLQCLSCRLVLPPAHIPKPPAPPQRIQLVVVASLRPPPCSPHLGVLGEMTWKLNYLPPCRWAKEAVNRSLG